MDKAAAAAGAAMLASDGSAGCALFSAGPAPSAGAVGVFAVASQVGRSSPSGSVAFRAPTMPRRRASMDCRSGGGFDSDEFDAIAVVLSLSLIERHAPMR